MEYQRKKIEGWPNYSVDTLGVIYNDITEKKLGKRIDSRSGRAVAELWKNNKRTRIMWNRVVAIAFIPNPLNLPQVNHIGAPFHLDDNADNLEWVTDAQNKKHAVENGLSKKYDQSIDTLIKRVKQLSLDGTLIKIWEGVRVAARALNMDNSSIAKCARGETKSSYGYFWEYENYKIKKRRVVKQSNLDGSFVKYWDKVSTATKQLNLSKTSSRRMIGYCCQGKIKSVYGYKWEYVWINIEN